MKHLVFEGITKIPFYLNPFKNVVFFLLPLIRGEFEWKWFKCLRIPFHLVMVSCNTNHFMFIVHYRLFNVQVFMQLHIESTLLVLFVTVVLKLFVFIFAFTDFLMQYPNLVETHSVNFIWKKIQFTVLNVLRMLLRVSLWNPYKFLSEIMVAVH